MSVPSSLLIQEPPLQVLPTLAVTIGLEEAIILQQLHWWLGNPKVGEVHDDHKWIYNTYEGWHENFPFWSVSGIRKIIGRLEDADLVWSTDAYNTDPRDRTKWYTINYELLSESTGHLPPQGTPPAPAGQFFNKTKTTHIDTVADATDDPDPKPKRRTTKPRYENLTDTEREMFDAFWSAYPHYPGRSKKAETVASWHRLDVGDDLFVQIMDALAWFTKSPDWTRDNGQAVPGAQVWLNQERWQDAQGSPAPTNITPIHGQQQEVDTSLITFPDGTTDHCPKELYGTERTTWFKRRWAEWQRTNTQGDDE